MEDGDNNSDDNIVIADFVKKMLTAAPIAGDCCFYGHGC